MKPGIYANIPIDQYHSGPGISKSQLDLINTSELHYAEQVILKRRTAPTPSMILGSAVHCAVLEPHLFETQYCHDGELDSINGRTTEGKKLKEQFYQINAGKIVLSYDQFSKVMMIRNSILSHPKVKHLLKPSEGLAESSAYWENRETGLLCRCRPDFLRTADDIILDVKTTTDASVDEFTRQLGSYRYHVQGAFYLEGASLATGNQYNHFLFIAAETKPPYGVAVYRLNDAAIEKGREVYKKDLEKFVKAQERLERFKINPSEQWLGFSEEIEDISIPGYLF